MTPPCHHANNNAIRVEAAEQLLLSSESRVHVVDDRLQTALVAQEAQANTAMVVIPGLTKRLEDEAAARRVAEDHVADLEVIVEEYQALLENQEEIDDEDGDEEGGGGGSSYERNVTTSVHESLMDQSADGREMREQERASEEFIGELRRMRELSKAGAQEAEAMQAEREELAGHVTILRMQLAEERDTSRELFTLLDATTEEVDDVEQLEQEVDMLRAENTVLRAEMMTNNSSSSSSNHNHSGSSDTSNNTPAGSSMVVSRHNDDGGARLGGGVGGGGLLDLSLSPETQRALNALSGFGGDDGALGAESLDGVGKAELWKKLEHGIFQLKADLALASEEVLGLVD